MIKGWQEEVHMSRVKEVKDIFVDNQDVHFVLCLCFLSSECKRQHIPAQGHANVLRTTAVCRNLVKLTWPESWQHLCLQAGAFTKIFIVNNLFTIMFSFCAVVVVHMHSKSWLINDNTWSQNNYWHTHYWHALATFPGIHFTFFLFSFSADTLLFSLCFAFDQLFIWVVPGLCAVVLPNN